MAVIAIAAAIFFLSKQSGGPAIEGTGITITQETGFGIGDKAPDFALESREGGIVTLYETLQEKPVFVNFWAAWCPFCIDEMPDMQASYEVYADKVEILAINRGEDPETALNYIDRTLPVKVTYPILLDPNEIVSREYIKIGMPVSYFIAKDGTIIDRKFGPLTAEEIDEKMRRLAEER